MARKRTARIKRRAAKAPSWLQHIAASKNGRPRRSLNRRGGTFGQASEVRHIDPSKVIA